jgi:hypothetical protein
MIKNKGIKMGQVNMQKYAILAVLLFAVSGCASAPVKPAAGTRIKIDAPASGQPRPLLQVRGMESVIGADSDILKRMFGEPRLDVIEVNGRKLQFTGPACILDTYLYPDTKSGREVVTYVDARRSDGAAVDKQSCIQALQKR